MWFTNIRPVDSNNVDSMLAGHGRFDQLRHEHRAVPAPLIPPSATSSPALTREPRGRQVLALLVHRGVGLLTFNYVPSFYYNFHNFTCARRRTCVDCYWLSSSVDISHETNLRNIAHNRPTTGFIVGIFCFVLAPQKKIYRYKSVYFMPQYFRLKIK